MSIAAVILAAGLSTRLGRPKQRLVFDGEMLVERAVRVATEGGFAPLVVVLSDAELMDSVEAKGALALLNRCATDGISSSIAIGVSAAQQRGVAGVVLMTCDQPAVTAEHLRALCAEPEMACGSLYAGRAGIPAYFPAEDFSALLALEGDRGARELLRHARAVANEELAFDIDTEADVVCAREMLEG